VQDVNDSVADSAVWGDTADYDIGDSVPFKLTATLGSNVEQFDTYKVVFTDTLSKGLTYNDDAVIKIDGTEVKGFTFSHENNVLTVSCNDVINLGAGNNSVITVEYTAALNAEAVIGNPGNPNTVVLNYSNDPNSDTIGKTPEDTTVVFTYKTVINKVDEDEITPLKGAEFQLDKYDVKNDKWTLIDRVTINETGTTFTFSGLDDGKYRLTETKTPDGYNTMDPVEFEIIAETDGEPEGTVLDFTAKFDAGSLTTNVVNEKGSILPSTGGMGTTLLYVLGGLLIVGAGTALVMKRRRA